ncbi:MAG: hypothetical protein Tsb0013_08760 [Phycisphaerales bacterium]
MNTTLRTIALCAGLAIAPGAALAQQSHRSVTRQDITTNDHAASLVVKDGEATLTVNGELIELPPAGGDWTEYEVMGENGEVICVVTRSEDGASYQLQMLGVDVPRVPGLAPTPDTPRVRGLFVEPGYEARGTLAPRAFTVVGQPRVMLGVRLDTSLDDVDLSELGLDARKASRINFLMEGAPAQQAGLQVGDLIVGIGDREGGTIDDIRAALEGREPGDTVTVRLLRNGEKLSKRVKLDPFSAQVMGGTNVIIEREDSEAMRARMNELNAELDGLKLRIAETQSAIQRSENPDELRELAAQMRKLADRTASLNRMKAELAAQRAARLAEQMELELEQRLARELEGDDVQRRFPGLLRRGGSGGGRFFIEPEGEGSPIIIERDFEFKGLDDVLPEELRGLLDGMIDGRFERFGDGVEIELERMLNLGEEMGEELELRLGDLNEEVEARMDAVEREFDDRLSSLEERLGRIERLLERLIDR